MNYLKIKRLYEKELFENKNKNYFGKVFNNENIKINNSIDKYKINLRRIKIPPLVPINNKISENKKLDINFPEIKMFYYKKYIKPKIIQIKLKIFIYLKYFQKY